MLGLSNAEKALKTYAGKPGSLPLTISNKFKQIGKY